MFTRYHGNFLFSPSRDYPRFILSTASVRARLPRSFSGRLARGAREVQLANGQRRSKLFSTEPPKRYFPVSNARYRSSTPRFECVSPFQYFFLLLLLLRSRNFQSSSTRSRLAWIVVRSYGEACETRFDLFILRFGSRNFGIKLTFSTTNKFLDVLGWRRKRLWSGNVMLRIGKGERKERKEKPTCVN